MPLRQVNNPGSNGSLGPVIEAGIRMGKIGATLRRMRRFPGQKGPDDRDWWAEELRDVRDILRSEHPTPLPLWAFGAAYLSRAKEETDE